MQTIKWIGCAAVLLVPGWLSSFAGKVAGRPVAIIPSRSRLIVGGDGDEPCLKQLVEAARREYHASPRSISPALYTVADGGAVIPLVLPRGHPLAIEVALGHAVLAMNEYKLQQDLLQGRQDDDDDLYIATLQARQGAETVTTFATWAKDVPTSLPQADEIVIEAEGSDGESTLRVPWQMMFEVAPGFLRPEPSLEPPRWRTEGWPDAATMAKLRAAPRS